MKNIILLLTIFAMAAACTDFSENESDNRFIGTWQLPMIDQQTKTVIDTLTMVFSKDGIITYSSKGPYTYEDGSTKENYSWTEKYQANNGKLVTTDNDSKKTKADYKFISKDRLQIDLDNNVQILTRIK
ncbi:hypothetical protein [Polluticaenibacter yanchengensis]|uniref:Lipocalin-like domain-containing protein n=1 Tax=Polluticaenibacter yanchengensis TaxID=3014562 RepID=A0ABT4UNE7_9BACT|nr:hypothetical protein [Chitinophagaceae bacterium LY-5]